MTRGASGDEASGDRACVRFLQATLPRLGYRWAGFRKVRRQVCRRVKKRYRELGLSAFDDYADRLAADAEEWHHLDECCRITISRFYRDRRLWHALATAVLPQLYARVAARSPSRLRVWSAGCGAGEEPYTLAILTRLGSTPAPPEIEIEIVATDLDPNQLERAGRAVYPESSLRDLPAEWRERAFDREPEGHRRLSAPFASDVRLYRQDLRHEAPPGRFDLVLCRNLAFTYFDAAGQQKSCERLLSRLEPRGWLALGSHEAPPEGAALVRPLEGLPLFARPPAGA